MIGKTVFIVSGDYGYEGFDAPRSVWTTRRKAEEEVKRLTVSTTYGPDNGFVITALVLS